MGLVSENNQVFEVVLGNEFVDFDPDRVHRDGIAYKDNDTVFLRNGFELVGVPVDLLREGG
jgi:hypothetical protein